MLTCRHDMAKPRQADRVVEVAYAIAMIVNIMVSVSGYLMYGMDVSDEVSFFIYDLSRIKLKMKGQPGSSSNTGVLANDELDSCAYGRSQSLDQAASVTATGTSLVWLILPSCLSDLADIPAERYHIYPPPPPSSDLRPQFCPYPTIRHPPQLAFTVLHL
jgi:hypothetical protein